MNSIMRRCVGAWVAVVLIVMAGLSAQGQSYWTNSVGGNWQDGANWTNGAPSAGGGSTLGLVFQPNATYTANNDFAGDFAISNITVNAGTVTLTGGTLQLGAAGYVTNNSAGLLTLNNDIRGPAGIHNYLYIGGMGAGGLTLGGRVIGSNASLYRVSLLSSINTTHSGIYSNALFRFEAASGTTGTISGVVKNCGGLDLGGSGSVIFSGVATSTVSSLRIGYYAAATPVQWRGTGTFGAGFQVGGFAGAAVVPTLEVGGGGLITVVDSVSYDFSIAHVSGGGNSLTNILTVGTNGTVTVGERRFIYIGQYRNGILNVQSNGIISFNGATNIVLAAAADHFGYINLDGGVLAARPSIVGSNGNSVVNFHGGMLRALTNNANWIAGLSNAVVKAGGAVIDTQAYTNTIPQSLIHDASLGAVPDGGLIKLGSGTLIFTGTNTYTGPTTVSNGTLRLAFDNGLASNGTVTVVSSGILDMAGFSQSLISLAGNGIITNVNSGKPLTVTGTNTFSGTVAGSGALTVSGVISPAGAGLIGQETIAGNLALSGTLAVDVATDGTSDLLVTQGTLDLTGAKLSVVNPGNLSIDKRYTVLVYSNTPIAGSFTVLTPNWTTKDDVANKRILLRRIYDGSILTIQ